MHVSIIKKKKVPRSRLEQGAVFVTMSPVEALALIRSLAQQLADGNPNANRLEQHCKETGTYFSIAVDDAWMVKDYEKTKLHLEQAKAYQETTASWMKTLQKKTKRKE